MPKARRTTFMANSTSAAEDSLAPESTRRAISNYATAWLAGDRPAMLASYHDDFTLHYFGRNPLAGFHRGKPAALPILAEVPPRSTRKLPATAYFMPGPDPAPLLFPENFARAGNPAQRGPLTVDLVRTEFCWP